MTTSTVTNPLKAFALIVLGLALVAMALYGDYADDKPGTPIVAFLLMAAAVLTVVRSTRHQLPTWVARTTLAVGVIVAALAAFLIHARTVAGLLFPQPADVPSVSTSAPPPQWAPAADRARALARAAVAEQNLPGVSIAVGADGRVVWAEGFGWRDVVTRAPVTPHTRFNIGTAAPVISAAPVASFGMINTGTDSAADWSPSHNGEPEDDFPAFTFVHDMILRPIGIAGPARPLAGERATYYVPRSDNDPRRGRWPIYMRDLVCCPGRMSFYSTPADLVRFALATNTASLDGRLARGSVMSLRTRDTGMVVAVASNIAYADTSGIAVTIGDVFAKPPR